MKIGLIGGTFDPIHYGHLILAEYVRESCKLDKVIFIPTGLPPHKDLSKVKDSETRLKMTKLGTNSNPYFQVSDIETYRIGISYTIDTLLEFKELYPRDQIYFIMGADSLFDLSTWKDYQKIIQAVNLIAVNRPGGKNHLIGEKIKEYNEAFGSNIIEVESPLIDISSLDIRTRVKNGKSIKYLLPSIVEDYISRNNLYKEGF
jgi:nicotinate-nucleotide adenylyltransferase